MKSKLFFFFSACHKFTEISEYKGTLTFTRVLSNKTPIQFYKIMFQFTLPSKLCMSLCPIHTHGEDAVTEVKEYEMHLHIEICTGYSIFIQQGDNLVHL